MLSSDVFDHCPSCARKTFLRRLSVYKCTKCSRFFCDKCRAGNFLVGHKCPHCKYHISSPTLSQSKIGYC